MIYAPERGFWLRPGILLSQVRLMHVFRLISAGSPDAYRRILAVTALAGLANAGLVGLINQVVETAAKGHSAPLDMRVLYLLVCLLYLVASQASLRMTNALVQRRLVVMRERFVGKVCRAPLRTVEQIGHGRLFAVLGQEMTYLSQNLPIFVNAAQNGFLLVFLLLYIATLSLPSFFILGGVTMGGLYMFWRHQAAMNDARGPVHEREAALLDATAHFTEGFQELRLNADKSDGLFRHYGDIAQDLERAVVGAGRQWVALLQFSNVLLYTLLGTVIFILPIFFSTYTDTIYKIAAAAIFCLGPVTAIIAATHLYAKVEAGLRHVHELEDILDSEDHGPPAAPASLDAFAGFGRIDYHALRFSYLDPDGSPAFTFGPCSFSLTRGETVFLTGGNGAGKSTAMKLLSGLYTPQNGRILVDDRPVTANLRQAFREQFAAIFPDFHLFDRLHGLGAVDPARVDSLIERMELSHKVSFADGRFSTLDLSTGQRKRLAMIAALLEDRDIYLFDEWAADQDAHFREVFYTAILPDLRARGKTVVAVTHDDRYWSFCDRRLILDLGTLCEATDAPSSDSSERA